ncbi:MAG: class C sortase [Clostridiales bacterium]|nr:class C sortase [Clostridiales bacterium]
MKNKIKIIVCILIFAVGLSVLLYPAVSNYLHQKHQLGVIDDYRKQIEKMSQEQIDELKSAAREYNELIADHAINGSTDITASNLEYKNLLNVNDDVMAYITIPVCDISLPIRHGCGEDVLQKSAGHIPESSLPIGGKNTHAVITAHRGLPSAKLFTNIDRLKEGDLFFIHGLDETLAYKVDQIKVVLPDDTTYLQISPGKDYVTLLTCTPYGINTHRLLVRGERTKYIPEVEEDQVVNAKKKHNKMVLLYAIGIIAAVLVMLIIYFIRKRRIKKKL